MKFSRYNLKIQEEATEKGILFNTLTGNIFYVSEAVFRAIENDDIFLLDSVTLQEFQKYGIVIDDMIDERRYFSYFHNKSKFQSDVVAATVLLTWACNLSCIYCYEGAGQNTQIMNQNIAENFIQFMKMEARNRRARFMHITLFGGEPLVNIQQGFFILDELYTYCKLQNIYFSCSVITNGTLLDDLIIKKLLLYNCNMIQITLDGIKNTHNQRRPYKDGTGSFDDVINAIKRLTNYLEIKSVIRINIDKTNLKDTEKLLEYLGNKHEKLTSCSVDFGIVRGTTAACSSYSNNCLCEAEIGDTLYHLWNIAEHNGFQIHSRPTVRWMFCGLYSDSQFTISPDGGVYKCWEHAGIPEHKIGELDNMGQIINRNYAYFDWMSKNPLEDQACSACVYLPVCGGGCGSISYNETGNYHAKGCFKVKGVVEKQIQQFVKEQTNNKLLGMEEKF